mmetsp:Transcript_6852/g.17234  ORF Transcript_6852/g.17234 Transcript_6852/m.17234 type:complete len:909 (-) Transcript_6852:266-2992(-)
MRTEDSHSVTNTPEGTPRGKKNGRLKRLGKAIRRFFSARKEKKEFSKADKEHDGKLTLNEWASTLKRGKDPIGCSLLTLFHFDKAEDGQLTEEDFHNYKQYLHEVQKRRKKLKLKKYRTIDSTTEAEEVQPASEEALQLSAAVGSASRNGKSKDPLEELEENFVSEERDQLSSFLQEEDGRVRFSKWLFQVADQDKSSSVSCPELREFLRVIQGDGISLASLYDHGEDDASVKSSGGKEEEEESVEDSDSDHGNEEVDGLCGETLRQQAVDAKIENLATTPTDDLYLQVKHLEVHTGNSRFRAISGDMRKDGDLSVRQIGQKHGHDSADSPSKSSLLDSGSLESGERSPREGSSRNKHRDHDQDAGRHETLDEELSEASERIMTQYNLTRSGELDEEEFSVLADIVGREYQLNQLYDFGGIEVGEFRIIRTVGRGAVGTVKYAVNKKTMERRAVKIMKRGEGELMKRLIREVQVMKMANHKNVIHVHEVLESSNFVFMFMEFAGGGKLIEHFAPGRPMAEPMARFYFKQLMEGLLHIHGLGVAHRDLKMDNLMLGQNGNLKIGDFGHAGLFKPGWDIFSTMTVGTLSHLSPEQVAGTPYSGQAIDIWSCGIILYQMLTGELPFEGETVETLMESIKAGDYIQPTNISESACRLIGRMLTVDGEKRPTAESVLDDPWLTGEKKKLTLLHCEVVPEGPPEDSELHAFVWDSVSKILTEKGVSVSSTKTLVENNGRTTFVGHSARCRHVLLDVRFSITYGLKMVGAKPCALNASAREECASTASHQSLGTLDSEERSAETPSIVQEGIVVGVGKQDKGRERSRSALVGEMRAKGRRLVPVLELDLKHGDAWAFQKVFRHLAKVLECRIAKRKAKREAKSAQAIAIPQKSSESQAVPGQQGSFREKPPLHAV